MVAHNPVRNVFNDIVDPIKLAGVLWPDVTFYRKQREIIYSVHENDETIVPAGNMLGKDFVSAFIALWFFISRTPCRVITTSADFSQLESVLWGEIGRFITTCRYPLEEERGGILRINHMHIRKVVSPRTKELCPLSYLIGRVAAKGEGLLGHHVADTGDGVARTLLLGDEGSGVDQKAIDRGLTWARKFLLIGNPYQCNNYFRQAVKGNGADDKGGDIPRPTGRGYYRKVIKITALDSPNVQYGEAERAAGMVPSGRVILPGVLPYTDYAKRRATWDKIRQCISLDAEFYDGAEVLMFPPEWLNRAEERWVQLAGVRRRARAVGIDPAEGGDETCMVAVDEYGVVDVVARKTPNTDDIPREALAFMFRHKVPANMVFFDRGGGGKQHADRLRAKGHEVNTIAFGSPATSEPMRRTANFSEKLEDYEERYAYYNKRAEMYGLIRELMDPGREYTMGELGAGRDGFCLYPDAELRRQLAPIPLVYDDEGRLRLPSKNKKTENSTAKTLTEIIGCSPDRADALALAVYGLVNGVRTVEAGAIY